MFEPRNFEVHDVVACQAPPKSLSALLKTFAPNRGHIHIRLASLGDVYCFLES